MVMTGEEPLYRDRVVAVEPGGNEPIRAEQRHGSPLQLLWTWTSPNLEFATIFVGVLAVTAFGMPFWQAVAGLAVGCGLSAVAHFVLSARGPVYGVPQMVLGRAAFGYRGNALPSTIMAIMGGVGWFATNSVSGAFALNTLTGMSKPLSLLVIVLVQTGFAFCGHNLIQAFERFAFPLLAVVFAAVAVVIFSKAELGGHQPSGGVGGMGGFLLTVGAAFGYAAGWTPYGADYTRYLPETVSRVRTGLCAGTGLFVSCLGLMAVGAASTTVAASVTGAASPTDVFTDHLPGWLAQLTLLAIAIGAIAANALNVYSGSIAFVTIGIALPSHLQRALVTVVFGVVGGLVALWALPDAAHSYESFLLIAAYWIGPWLGVMFVDQFLRRRTTIAPLLYDRSYTNHAGVFAFVVGTAVSVLLFSNQPKFVGYLVRSLPELGDVTAVAGFVLSAGLYASLRRTVMGARA